MGITAKDIAKELGVSTSAVSIALNGRKGIGDDTRKRILAVAREKGYFQKHQEPGRRQEVRFIVYSGGREVINEIPFYPQVLKGAEQMARELGVNLIVSHCNKKTLNAEMLEELGKEVSGILFMGTELMVEDPLCSLLKNYARCPVVIIDSPALGDQADSIVTDNIRGAYKAVQYLAEKGHRKIGYLSSKQRISNFDERAKGVQMAVDEFPGIELQRIPVTFSRQQNFNDICQWIDASEDLPTAMFADSDVIAFGAFQALQNKGLRIPEDISVIGFDDMEVCQMLVPSLTTIRVNKEQMGKAALWMLYGKIKLRKGKLPADTVYNLSIATTLIERESVRQIPL